MEVLKSIYRSKKVKVFKDGYGGSPSWKYFYTYIYISENICYLFSSINLYEVIGHINYEKLKPINSFDDSKTIRNMDVILKNAPYTEYKKISENEITFNMPVQVASEEIQADEFYNVVKDDILLVSDMKDGEQENMKDLENKNEEVVVSTDVEIENSISIDELNSGMYFIVIDNAITKFIKK